MKRVLTAPIRDEDLADLRIGDYIYYTGILATGRDEVHHRVVQLEMDCPVDLRGLALFHAGPIVQEKPGEDTIVAVGPTSSIRMEQETSDRKRRYGGEDCRSMQRAEGHSLQFSRRLRGPGGLQCEEDR